MLRKTNPSSNSETKMIFHSWPALTYYKFHQVSKQSTLANEDISIIQTFGSKSVRHRSAGPMANFLWHRKPITSVDWFGGPERASCSPLAFGRARLLLLLPKKKRRRCVFFGFGGGGGRQVTSDFFVIP